MSIVGTIHSFYRRRDFVEIEMLRDGHFVHHRILPTNYAIRKGMRCWFNRDALIVVLKEGKLDPVTRQRGPAQAIQFAPHQSHVAKT